jgi:hypothetical protein
MMHVQVKRTASLQIRKWGLKVGAGFWVVPKERGKEERKERR